jgi:hypothetical protein
MIGLLERVFGENRLITLVVTQGIPQAKSLREFARLVDELMNPLQVARALCPRQFPEKGPLPQP